MLRIYALVAMVLAPIFLITTLVGYSKYKSQSAKVVLLQEELVNLKAAQVSKVIEKMEESSKIGDKNLQDQTKIEVHKVETTKVIEKLVPIIQSAVITFVNLTHRQLKDETIDTHRAITDAILNGDSAGAKYAMIMHLNYNRQMILKKQAKAQQKNE